MAKKKHELEADAERYHALIRDVRAAHNDGRLQEAVALAVQALDFVDGMMQYERRFGDGTEHESVGCVDYILWNGPLTFDLTSVEAVENLLKSTRRIERNTTKDISRQIDFAKSLTWAVRRLWNHLEENEQVKQNELRRRLGGEHEFWRHVVETWERMGFVRRTPEGGSYRISIVSRLDETVRGKCPSCGVTGTAKKERFLDEIRCPKCQATVHFVLLEMPEDSA